MSLRFRGKNALGSQLLRRECPQPGKASLPRVHARCAKGPRAGLGPLARPRHPRGPSAWEPPGRGQRVPTPAGAEAARPRAPSRPPLPAGSERGSAAAPGRKRGGGHALT